MKSILTKILHVTEDEKKEKIMEAALLLGLAVVLLILHGNAKALYLDDLEYLKAYQEYHLGLLQKHYFDWSSRLVIELFCMLFSDWGIRVWAVVDVLMIVLLTWNIADLFGGGKRLWAEVVLCILYPFFPRIVLFDCGYVTATANYLWVLTLGSLALRPLKKMECGEKIQVWEIVCSSISLIYAANQEQMAAILLGSYLVVGVDLLLRKIKISAVWYSQMALIVGMLIFIGTCPGNKVRYDMEQFTKFPEFEFLSLPEKLWSSFMFTFYLLIHSQFLPLGISLCLILAIVLVTVKIVKKSIKNKIKYNFLANIVVFLNLFLMGCLFVLFPFLKRGVGEEGEKDFIGTVIKNYYVPSLSERPVGFIWAQLAIYLIACVMILWTIWMLHEKREALFQIIILAAGFGSRLMLGLSPSVYVSGFRTVFFLISAVMIVTMRNVVLAFFGNYVFPSKQALPSEPEM